MASKTKDDKRSGADTYLDLIRRLPLRPIKNDDVHKEAVAIVGELLARRLDSGASDYLDTLILLVNKYEDEHHSPKGVDLSPQEALRAIMTANGMSQADMGRILGSESAVSMFLKGERGLSKASIKTIATRFRIDASLFL